MTEQEILNYAYNIVLSVNKKNLTSKKEIEGVHDLYKPSVS